MSGLWKIVISDKYAHRRCAYFVWIFFLTSLLYTTIICIIEVKWKRLMK